MCFLNREGVSSEKLRDIGARRGRKRMVSGLFLLSLQDTAAHRRHQQQQHLLFTSVSFKDAADTFDGFTVGKSTNHHDRRFWLALGQDPKHSVCIRNHIG